MIKEYEDIKEYIYKLFINKYSPYTVTINNMYTEEYNAFEISITGINILSTDFYSVIKSQIKKEWSHIINDFEKLSGVIPGKINNIKYLLFDLQHLTILIYLKPIIEIRYNKIDKIKLKISA
jgi:hypothetical protein